MVDITIINTQGNSKITDRIHTDLQDAGHNTFDKIQAGRKALMILILSAESVKSETITTSMVQALENRQHIIPVVIEDVTLPHLIDHMPIVDFRSAYNAKALLEQVALRSSPDAPAPMTVLTPSKRAENQRILYIIGGVIVLIFVVSIYLVGIDKRVQPPIEEFAGVETQVFLTRSSFIEDALPRSTEDASNFEITIEYMPTLAQVQLRETATANAMGMESIFIPRSTEDATNFPATLQYVSTVVQERLAATVTNVALTSQAITATPTNDIPPATPTPNTASDD